MKKYKPTGDELMGVTEISPEDVFYLYSSHGLSPTQIESLGYSFDRQKFAEKMEAHQALSKKGAEQKDSVADLPIIKSAPSWDTRQRIFCIKRCATMFWEAIASIGI